MAIYATAGSKLYIGGVQPMGEQTISSFTGQTWVEIKSTEGLGSVGDTSEAIAIQTIDDPRTRTIKGTRSAGVMEVVCALDSADPGQDAVVAAEKRPDDYAFKLVLNDAPAGGTASQRLFVGKVMSATEQFDQANSAMKLVFSIAVNSNIVRVDATPA